MESANTLNAQVIEKKRKLLDQTHFHCIKNKGEGKKGPFYYFLQNSSKISTIKKCLIEMRL